MFATNRSHSRVRFRAFVVLALLAVVATSSAQDTALESIPAINRPVDFAKEVFPVFEKSCLVCHGAAQQMGELRLDSKTIAMRGGTGGPAVIPGQGNASPLLKRIAHVDGVNPMPMGGAKLTNDEIALIRAWINQGRRLA